MRSAITDYTREVAETVFDQGYCHPEALKAVAKEEPSAVVWLLAALFYKASRTYPTAHRGWPSIFMHPAHRINVAPFCSQVWRVHSRENNRQLIAWDTEALRKWLAYARNRLRAIERMALARYFVELLQGDAMAGAQPLMWTWEARR